MDCTNTFKGEPLKVGILKVELALYFSAGISTPVLAINTAIKRNTGTNIMINGEVVFDNFFISLRFDSPKKM